MLKIWKTPKTDNEAEAEMTHSHCHLRNAIIKAWATTRKRNKHWLRRRHVVEGKELLLLVSFPIHRREGKRLRDGRLCVYLDWIVSQLCISVLSWNSLINFNFNVSNSVTKLTFPAPPVESRNLHFHCTTVKFTFFRAYSFDVQREIC